MVCFTAALIIIGIFAYLAYRKRHNMSDTISCILLGIFFSTFFMVLPTQWVKESAQIFSKPLYTLLSSLFYSLKTLGGRQDIAQIESIELPFFLQAVCIGLSYIGFTLAPILASGLILSFIGDFGERMRFCLSFSPKCYVFSGINEKALALAEGFRKKAGKKTIVFCGGKDADKALVAKAKKLGAIVLHKPCDALPVGRRFQVYEFCLIDDDEDRNIHLAETMIAKHANTQTAKIRLNALVASGTNVTFLESILKKNTASRMELRCIDEITLFCHHLIGSYPLYDTKGSDTISVAIVGCGWLGMRMLKTAWWAGQIDTCKLKIRVYDKEADACREKFYQQCPGLKDEKAIAFIPSDVETAAFEDALLKNENSGDATYIVVAMGNDHLNLSVADRLYRIYRRHFSFYDQRMPEIFARIRSQDKNKPYMEHTDFLESRHIHLFGTTASIFSEKTLFNTELDHLAFAVHLAYKNKLHLDSTAAEYAELKQAFRASDYDRRSSMAVALHFPAKLYMCDQVPKQPGNLLTQENLEYYAQAIAGNAALRHRLAVNEHDRWNAFLLTEGYQTATEEQMLLYAQAEDNHKDKKSLLHPCITGWEQLDALENLYNTTFGKTESFKASDRAIVEQVAEIWAVAQKMKGE